MSSLHRLTLSCSLLSALLLLACTKAPPKRLNLVLVVIDTLRADRMSLYGHKNPTTPELERWAAGGTVWDDAHAPAPWTIPSMTMLLSGRQVVRRFAFPDADRVPLAEHLQKHGYRGGAVISNALLRAEKGWSRGFEFFEQDHEVRRSTYDDGWPGERVVQRGLDWLATRDERPFFLYLHLLDPHHPYKPSGVPDFKPELSAERREHCRSLLPDAQKSQLTEEDYRGIEQRIAAYDGEVLEADQALGKLFRYLEREGLADSTLVVVTADHGECLWERPAPKTNRARGLAHFPQLFSGHGEVVYEELLRVPLVLRGPGVPAGVRSKQGASLLDVVPTVLSLLDLPTIGALDGRVLDPAASDVPQERVAYFTHTCALTLDGRWKLHLGKGRSKANELFPPELYDLAADPLERHPLADAQRSAALKARLEQWLAEHDDKAIPLTDKDRDALRALGYLGKDEQGDGIAADPAEEPTDADPDGALGDDGADDGH
jgi:arylsulfatase A-like enzyme